MRTHEIKCAKHFFGPVIGGIKTFEYRDRRSKRDGEPYRNYQPGDLIKMREYDDELHLLTGRHVIAEIGFVLSGPTVPPLPPMPDHQCIFSFWILKKERRYMDSYLAAMEAAKAECGGVEG